MDKDSSWPEGQIVAEFFISIGREWRDGGFDLAQRLTELRQTAPAPLPEDVNSHATWLLSAANNNELSCTATDAVRVVVSHLTAQAEDLAAKDAEIAEIAELSRERVCLMSVGDALTGSYENFETPELIVEAVKRTVLSREAAEARNARLIEWMRGKCECCGETCCEHHGKCRQETACGDWTPPAGLEV